MSAVSNLTNIAYVVKKIYKDGVPENLASRGRVFMSRVRKVGGFTGSNMEVPVKYGNPQGVSAVLTSAQTLASSSKGMSFTVTRAKKYGVCTIDAETIAATGDDKGAFVRAVTTEIDGMLDTMGEAAAVDLYGDGWGVLGQRASISTNTVTLVVPSDTKNFSVGMYVSASQNDASHTARTITAPNYPYVTAIDEDAGTVTLNDASYIASFANNDYLYRYGDRNACMKGLGAWIPATAPASGDSFFGQDRSVDVVRLAGSRVTDTALPPEEALQTLATSIAKRGGRPTEGYVNPVIWDRIQKRTGSQVQRDQGGTAVVGFEYIELATPAGAIKLFADPACPLLYGWLLDMRSWELRHLKGFPHIVTDDGLESIRISNDDGIEVRGRFWGQLVCTAPGWNGICCFAA